MKLLLVTSLKDDQEQVAHLLEQAGIMIFSMSETVGIKGHAPSVLADRWFGSEAASFDSRFMFSITKTEHAQRALALIKIYNEEHETAFPVRGFIIPVEQASYDEA